MAFADDILIIADDEKEAKKLIQAMASLSEAGLHLNKDKSNLNRIEEIEGVKRSDKFKYLGLKVSCHRGELLRDAKASVKKYMGLVKGKILTKFAPL